MSETYEQISADEVKVTRTTEEVINVGDLQAELDIIIEQNRQITASMEWTKTLTPEQLSCVTVVPLFDEVELRKKIDYLKAL